MQAYIPSRNELEELIHSAVKSTIREMVPSLLREATQKEYLTKDEVMKLTGFSSRKLQYLRDTRQIPYNQHGRKIVYPYEGVKQFLEINKIKPVQ